VRSVLSVAGIALAAGAQWPAANALAQPPVASFVWYPASPYAGELISVTSTSTDAVSPIATFAWDLEDNGAFGEGGPLASVTFSTPGHHVVRLRVTAADGSASEAAETIEVAMRPALEILPRPIVRIVATQAHSGVKLRLLSVEAPRGSAIVVRCRGRGCPVRSQSILVTSSHVGTVTTDFRRFERFLPAGVTLDLRISKPGEIGKYTRLTIRRGRPPARLDECLDSSGTPSTCSAPVAATPGVPS
jgi:PKD repeat protein